MKRLDIPCPQCTRKTIYLASWTSILNILAPRSWHVCSSCGYEIELGKLKKEMLSI